MSRVVINVPEWFQKNYPEWKQVLWRVVRAFVSGFLASILVFIDSADFSDLGSEENRKKLLLSLIVGAFSGGVTAVGKLLRNLYPEVVWIQKLPF